MTLRYELVRVGINSLIVRDGPGGNLGVTIAVDKVVIIVLTRHSPTLRSQRVHNTHEIRRPPMYCAQLAEYYKRSIQAESTALTYLQDIVPPEHLLHDRDNVRQRDLVFNLREALAADYSVYHQIGRAHV